MELLKVNTMGKDMEILDGKDIMNKETGTINIMEELKEIIGAKHRLRWTDGLHRNKKQERL